MRMMSQVRAITLIWWPTLLIFTSLSGYAGSYFEEAKTVALLQPKLTHTVISSVSQSIQKVPVKIEESTLPWLKRPITLQGRGLAFSFYVQRLLNNSNVVVFYEPDVDRHQRFDLAYEGTIEGALDLLAQREGFTYRLEGARLTWSRFETKLFSLPFMPNFNKERKTPTGMVTTWEELYSAVKRLASSEGGVWLAPHTRTLTVRDYPLSVKAITEYVSALREVLAQPVAIHVKQVIVDLNPAYAGGIDWNLVQQALPPQPNQDTLSAPAILQNATEVNTLLTALKQQGRVAVVPAPTVLTLSNHSAHLTILRAIAWRGHSRNVGMVLNFLPRLADRMVYLNLQGHISLPPAKVSPVMPEAGWQEVDLNQTSRLSYASSLLLPMGQVEGEVTQVRRRVIGVARQTLLLITVQ